MMRTGPMLHGPDEKKRQGVLIRSISALRAVMVSTCCGCRALRSSFSAVIVSSCCVYIAARVSLWRCACSCGRARLSYRMNSSPPAITCVYSTPATIYPIRIAECLISNSASCTVKADCWTASVAV